MGVFILSVIGLCLFEVVSSIDNAVINADVLATMDQKWRRWFFVWGIFFSVFLVRGLLPWLIVWISNPEIGFWNAFMASFSSDSSIQQSIEHSSPLLLIAGGIFLVFLFFHWLFLEPKQYGLDMEKFFSRQGAWFFAVVSILLTVIIWLALKKDSMLAFAASIGSSVFFITHGFKQHASHMEVMLKDRSSRSDISKLLYLEVIDATFSIDGVIGAFAFTMSVPLIILGNGLGAVIVRELTIRGVDRIKKYPFLKNGAMYSIFFLGMIMLLEGFGIEIPQFVSPVMTFLMIGYFLVKSFRAVKPLREEKGGGN